MNKILKKLNIKAIIPKLLIITIISLTNFIFAFDLNNNYAITIINKNFKNEENTTILKTVGFLPVNKNTIDEITLNPNLKIKLESKFQIQIINEENNNLSIKIDFEDSQSNIHEEKTIKKNEFFKITDNLKFKIDSF